MPDSPPARLSLSHATVAVRDLDAMLDFYCGVLGFAVTNRGTVGDEARWRSSPRTPAEHHQMVFVSGMPRDRAPVRDGRPHGVPHRRRLDDLRAIGARLDDAGVEGVIPINHGNAWSLYFNDPEGNGLECFVDSPFHVAQPFADALDLERRRRDDRGRHPGEDRGRRRVPAAGRLAGRVPSPPRQRRGGGVAMDLGISGRRRSCCASSRGLGRACAESIAREGVHVVVNGRTAADVDTAVAELRDCVRRRGGGVVGDSSTQAVHDALLDACPEPDIVLLNGEGSAAHTVRRASAPRRSMPHSSRRSSGR